MFNRYLNVIEDKHAESSQIEGEDDSKAKETKYSSWTGNPIAAVPSLNNIVVNCVDDKYLKLKWKPVIEIEYCN